MSPDPDSRHRPSIGVAPSAYRLPAATRLGRVRLQVADLERSLSFYQDILGLRMLGGPAGQAILGAQEDDTPLVELVERSGARSVSRYGRLGLYHVALLLPTRADLARFVRHLGETGVRAGMADHLVSEAVYLSDPDGLGLEVYADRPRENWRRDEEGQIVMATNPLDAESLVQAAGETPWTGFPAGSVVGHVHLHVDDLDRAAGLYHEVLGFDKMVWNYPGALFLAAGGYHHHLGVNTWAKDAPPATDEDARLLEWTLLVPESEDAEAAAQSLEENDFPLVRDGNARLITDPWGTSLRITPAQ